MSDVFASHKPLVLVGLVVFALAAYLILAATGLGGPAEMPGSLCPPHC